MKSILVVLFLLVTAITKAQMHNNSIGVYTTDSITLIKSTHTIFKPLTIAAGYTMFGLFTYRYLDDEIQEIAQADQNKFAFNAFKTIGYAGLGTSSIIITAGTGITALVTKNKRFEKTAFLLAGGHLINDFVTNQLKITFQRHRPNSGDAYNTFSWRDGDKSNASFISSHTSNAFTTATAFAICFSNKKWVPVVAYSTASVVGLSRIYENAHWTSDVLAGAAIGFLSAHAMNKLYSIAGKKFTFLPEVGNSHFGASVVYALK